MGRSADYLVNHCKHFEDKKSHLYVTSSSSYTLMLFSLVEKQVLQMRQSWEREGK